jgi:uncharacterized protein YbbC (DUF1343 family)
MKRLLACVLLLAPACACAQTGSNTPVPTPPVSAAVRPGIEVFLENPPAAIRGKSVGLITNQSGIDRERRSTIDLITGSGHVKLVALFSPEHGIRGIAETRVESSVDEKSGLPIHSLYGATYKPTPEMLEGVAALIYDIQDLGVRQYTYESTLVHAMQAAAEKKIPIVVLDRPNPVTGTIIEGNILEPAFKSFVGIYPVLSRHGMTLGELGRMYNDEQKIGADLIVVPVEGWRRNMWWDETGLPWVNPSPNIRRLEAAIHYPGTVFFEAINVSEGRGTDMPFEQVGAPWLKNEAVIAAMNELKLPGVRFEPVELNVAEGVRKYPGETLKGIRFFITDRASYRPLAASLLMIDIIRKLHPDNFEWRGANTREPGMLTIERHGGTTQLKDAIENGTLPDLLRKWETEQAAFDQQRAQYLLYQ